MCSTTCSSGTLYFFGKRHCALEHGVLHDIQDFRVVDRLPDILSAVEAAQICADGMAHVVDVQLALDIEIERRKRHKAVDLRHRALDRVPVHRQIAVALDADAHRVAVLHGRRLHGHHAPDGSLDQADPLVKDFLFFLGELRLEHPLERPCWRPSGSRR
jgi:hypothetical protein